MPSAIRNPVRPAAGLEGGVGQGVAPAAEEAAAEPVDLDGDPAPLSVAPDEEARRLGEGHAGERRLGRASGSDTGDGGGGSRDGGSCGKNHGGVGVRAVRDVNRPADLRLLR